MVRKDFIPSMRLWDNGLVVNERLPHFRFDVEYPHRGVGWQRFRSSIITRRVPQLATGATHGAQGKGPSGFTDGPLRKRVMGLEPTDIHVGNVMDYHR